MPDPMTPERLAEIRDRAAETDRAETVAMSTWRYIGTTPNVGNLFAEEPDRRETVADAVYRWDAEAILTARDDRATLLAEVERLRTELALSFGPRLYQQVQEVLDAAHGAGDGDGAGHGVVADVALLLEQRDRARGIAVALEQQTAAVEELHEPIPLYTDCGHPHDEDDDGVVEVDDIGYVCADGHMYDVCSCCCVTVVAIEDPFVRPFPGEQHLECVDNHTHGPEQPICRTRALLDGAS